jgi:hypothetical protein
MILTKPHSLISARLPPGEAESAPAAAVQALELTVEGVTSLNVAWLKEELKRRGRSIAGKKVTCRHA